MIENNNQLEDLFNKISSDEIQLSYSVIDKIAYYLLSKKEIPSIQLMKFLSLHYRISKLEIQRLDKTIGKVKQKFEQIISNYKNNEFEIAYYPNDVERFLECKFAVFYNVANPHVKLHKIGVHKLEIHGGNFNVNGGWGYFVTEFESDTFAKSISSSLELFPYEKCKKCFYS